MKKISYPENGIYKVCETDFDKAISFIKLAYSVNYVVPGSFPGAQYLAKLPSELEEYYNELKSIIDKVKNTSNKYENSTEELTAEAKNMEQCIIKDRDRMII